MSSQGVVLDIDTQFLDRLRRADEELRKIVGSVDNVTTSFTKLITTAGGQNKTIFADLAKQFEKIGSTKITANVDLSQLEKLMSTITDISSVMGAMSAKGKPLFDVKGIADSNAGIIETEKALAEVEKRINSLRQSYENTSAGFVASINPRTGAPYKSGKKYEEEKAAYMADDGVKAVRAEIEMQLKAEMEQKAILTRQLEFAKMTQDEKAKYVKKMIEQMLSDEKAFASQVQKEYLATVKEMTQVGGKHDKASAKNSDGSLNPQLEKYEMRFIELNDKRIQMEKQYGAYVYEVAVEAQSKIADLEIKRILDRKAAEKKANDEAVDRYRSTPAGAMQFAGSAQTVSEMREAMAYLQTARDNTNVKDTKTIEELNKKYIELRATVESLTTAEKNENSLQPSIRNEYIRLLRELEKIADAKKKLESITPTWENYPTITESSEALEAREKDIQNKIATIREAAKEKLEETDNQYRAERAERDISEEKRVQDEKVRIARQKYQESLNALMEIERLQSQVDRAKLTSGGIANTDDADDELARQKREVTSRIEEIERKHADAIQDIRDKHNRKRIQADLDADRQRLANTVQVDAQIQRIIDKAQNMSGWDAFKNKFNSGKLIDTTSVDGAIAAINKLKEARDRLNKDDFGGNTAKYQRALNHINQEIQRQETYVERLRGSHTRLKKDAEQLKSTLQRVFGLAAIKSFASKLVSVRGEFEMQRKSLEVLLQNKGEADLLWQKTVDLAVKSPYTTQQLVTATKQLAAYRIESHKLYSTTKMLTDISAGLGVEVNRLVLAYGQVKAANFLRGTELRQFSEAGVNLLDELSEYYTQLEGKAVTVQQVFDRISNRLVSFKDVEAVLQRITGAGGAFYNMQEQQSETLKGQILNLKDSIELMLNDMGSSTDGVIKTVVQGLKWMVDHWKMLAIAIGPAITAMLTMKTFITLTNLWKAATLALNKAWMANPILFIAGAALTVITSLISLVSATKSVSAEFVSQAKVFEENTAEVNAYAGAIVDLTERINELNSIENKTAEQERELEQATRARIEAIAELTDKNDGYAKSLRDAGDDIERLKKIVKQENARQNITKNFLALLSDVDVKGLNDANASLAKAQAKYNAIINRIEDLEKSGKNVHVKEPLKKALIEAEGDLSKLQELYEKYLKEQSEYAYAGDIFSFRFLSGFQDDDLHNWFREMAGHFKASIEANDIEGQLRETIRNSFPNTVSKGLLEALKKGEGSQEYQDAIEFIKDACDDLIKQGTDELGDRGSEVVTEEVAKMFDLSKDFMTNNDKTNLNAWAQHYNNAVAKIAGDSQTLYKKLAAAENESVTQKISALKRERTEREATIQLLKQQIKAALLAKKSGKGDVDTTDLQAELDKLTQESAAIDKALSLLGSVGSSGGSGGGYKGMDKWKAAVKTIKDVNNAYSKLSERFSKDVATTKLWEQWGDVINTNLSKIGFTAERVKKEFGELNTEKSIVNALEYLSKFGNKESIKEAKELLAEIRLNNENKAQDKAFDRFKDNIEDKFQGYELYMELSDLGISKDAMSDLFDIEAIDLPQLRADVISRKIEFEAHGERGLQEYYNTLRKIDEMEIKSQQDRLKKYLEFSRDAIGERGKILIEEFHRMQDIQKAFALTDTMAKNKGLIDETQFNNMREKGISFEELLERGDWLLMGEEWNFSAETLAKIKELQAELAAQQAAAEEASHKKTAEDLAKLDWEKLTGTEVYQDLYSDMSNASSAALTVLINKLEEHREQWSKLPVDQMQEYVNLLKEAKEALASSKKPSEVISTAKAEIKNSGFSTGEEASAAMIKAQLEIEQLDIAISQWETIAQLKREGNSAEEIALKLKISSNQVNAKSVDDLKLEKEAQEKIVSDSQMYYNAIKKINVAYEKQREHLNKVKECVDKVWEGWDEINSIFEDDTISTAVSGLVRGISDTAFSMGDVIIAIKKSITGFEAAKTGAEAMGFALDTASGIIGVIVLGVKLVASILKFAFEQHDKILQKQIDAQVEKVETLQKEYENLEKQIEKAYSAEKLGELTNEATKNLNDQKKATEEMIALEKDKKKPDQDAIDEWEESIEDINEQIAERLEDTFNTVTNSILDNVLDASKNFVDAWYDAFKETGNGMSGLKDTFKEMLLDMIKQQASMNVMGKYIAKYKEQLEKYIDPDNGDTTLSSEEAREFADYVGSTMEQANAELEGYFEAMSGVIDQFNTGELSGLQKGIQGITEDQAEVLASYWNSCRYLLANVDSTLTDIAVQAFGDSQGSNSIVGELKRQTDILRQIHVALDSVIHSGGESTHTGSYIKVLDA